MKWLYNFLFRVREFNPKPGQYYIKNNKLVKIKDSWDYTPFGPIYTVFDNNDVGKGQLYKLNYWDRKKYWPKIIGDKNV